MSAKSRRETTKSDYKRPGYANYKVLRDEELDTIVERRKQASCLGDSQREDVKCDLVGVALSGGGIRSAVFNLGFLQALSQRGFLRYVDYLCSVSGGGYVAGHLAALAQSVYTAPAKNSHVNQFHDITVDDMIKQDRPADQASPTERVADLGVDARGKLTACYRFRNIGNYLFSDVAGWAWRYLLFTLVTALLVVSLVGALASAAAFAWRSLDTETSQDFLLFTGIPELGSYLRLGDETLTAFLPSLIPFALLVVSASFVTLFHFLQFRRGVFVCGHWCAFWLRCFGVSLLISLAVFLGNGETSFSMQQSVDSLTHWQDRWVWPLFGLMVLSLLPLLRFRSVVNSARPDAPVWKGYLATTLMAFTCGAGPFFMVFWMARENVSGYATQRDPKLVRDDIQDWPAFAQLCKSLGFNDQNNNIQEAHCKLQQITEDLNSAEILGQKGWAAHELLPHQSISGLMRRFVWAWYFFFDRVDDHLVARDGATAQPTRNPIGTYRDLITKNRTIQNHAVDDFNEHFAWPNSKPSTRVQAANHVLLGSPKLTIKLVAIACGVAEPRPTFAKSHILTVIAAVREKFIGVSPQLAIANTPVLAAIAEVHSRIIGTDPNPPILQMGNGASTPNEIGAILSARSRDSDKFNIYWRRALLDVMQLRKKGEESNKATTEKDVANFLEPKLSTWTPDGVASFNRILLESLFPEVIRPRTMVSTLIVPEEDQTCRWQWLLVWSGLAFVLLFVDWNFISPFYVYYRNKLSQSFVQSAIIRSDGTADESRDVQLKELKPWLCGAPYPLMLASTHFFRSVALTRSLHPKIDPPDADCCQPFLFSPLNCGSAFTGWMATDKYCQGHITLADAVALSGAAVTPFMVNSLGITSLMAMANLRIGQWLPLPFQRLARSSQPWATGWRIGRELLRALQSTWSDKTPEEYLKSCQMALVADGGFHEFFGIEELLLRRCRLIVVADAGCNNGRYEFGALADVLRMMRIQHGITFVDLDHETPIEISWLKRDLQTAQQPLHFCCFRARYPESFPVEGPPETLIVYAQMSLTGDEDLDLQQFRNINPNFPDEPTTNQRYSADQVESYRQLGYHIGDRLCHAIPTSPANKLTAFKWGNCFCEAFVQEWRRWVGNSEPLVGSHIKKWEDDIPRDYWSADAAVTQYFQTPALREIWRHRVMHWFRSSKRPDEVYSLPFAQSNEARKVLKVKKQGHENTDKQAKIEDLVHLILASQACVRPGGDAGSELLFQPGGRARLCRAACEIVNLLSIRAVANLDASLMKRPLRLETQEDVLRLLRNVAFAPAGIPVAPEGINPPTSAAIDRSPNLGCQLAAILIAWWDQSWLPTDRLVCKDTPLATDAEIRELKRANNQWAG